MTELLRQKGVFDNHPFVLIDVGCSGGIDEAWRFFGDTLVALGYDPNIDACEKAQRQETLPHVHYHSRFVGLPDDHPFVQRRRADAERWPDTNIWRRTTAGQLAGRASMDANEVRLASPSTLVTVEEIARTERLTTIDFLKVDVDGPDLEVLESVGDLFADRQILGVGLEVNWFGSANPTEHTFHNTDLFLRDRGYALVGMSARKYSRIDLPAPFEYEMFAQTRFGQPYQGDAIYVRDLAASHNRARAADYADDKLVKLACIYELVGLPDCAAELINSFTPRFARFADPDALLNALTPPLLGKKVTYREYLKAFAERPELFLPSAAEPPRTPPRRLLDRIAALLAHLRDYGSTRRLRLRPSRRADAPASARRGSTRRPRRRSTSRGSRS